MPTGPRGRPKGRRWLAAAVGALALSACSAQSGPISAQPAGPSGSAAPSGSITATGSAGPSASITATGSRGPSGSVTATGSAGSVDLRIQLADGAGRRAVWQLACDPPRGNHPDPAAACQVLRAADPRVLAPTPRGRACTQVYGGPEQALVTGTLRGRAVSARFSRTDGCEIERWEALRGLLPHGPS